MGLLDVSEEEKKRILEQHKEAIKNAHDKKEKEKQGLLKPKEEK